MENEEKVQTLRQKIDALDREILRLLNERAEIAIRVGEAKKETQGDFYNPQREEEVIRHLSSMNSGPFPCRAISPVFREIISACRSLEVELAVAYLGPEATYTHQACMERFGSSIRGIPKESIPDVFQAVDRGEADFGIVPIENSTEGVVNYTLDMLIEAEVKICGEVLIRISHELLSQSGNPKDVRKIYSHPQALAQCQQWLRKKFPQVPLTETLSTAKAAQMAFDDPMVGAIASPLAARLYGLKVIESRIEDYLHNYTRFLVLGRKMEKRTGRDKTSLLFSIADSPGSLHQALKPFAENSINLTKIESRPIKDKPWNYIFFLDFEGHAADPQIEAVIAALKRNVLFMKLLGSYPRSS